MTHPITNQLPVETSVPARLIALALLAAGVGVGWYFGLQPLQDAQAGKAHVQYLPKALLVAPMLLISGLFLLVGGAPVLAAFRGPPQGRQQHLIVWSIFALSLFVGGLGWWWLDGQFDVLGYAANRPG